jgi:hypothetical protein
MKRFDDLLDSDVLALSDDDFKRWVDVECAYAGAPLLPPMPLEPLKPEAAADLVVYQIGSVTLKRPDDAVTVAALINGMGRFEVGYVSGPRYEKRAVPASGEIEVAPLRVFSTAHWEACKDELNAYTLRKTAYDEALAEYTKALELRDLIAESMNERRERVSRDEWDRIRMRENFTRYLDLAEGDRDVAIRFLFAAYPEAPRILPELAEAPDVMVPPAPELL